eukprot:4950553-Pyramimonas_sp.AAC.1
MAQGQRPPAATMDPPLYPDGSRVPNRCVRETADQFHRLTNARCSDPSVYPHMSFMLAPTMPDVVVQPTAHSISSGSRGVPDYIRQTHHAQQARLRRRQAVQSVRDQARAAALE